MKRDYRRFYKFRKLKKMYIDAILLAFPEISEEEIKVLDTMDLTWLGHFFCSLEVN